jgi:hypothetical protein
MKECVNKSSPVCSTCRSVKVVGCGRLEDREQENLRQGSVSAPFPESCRSAACVNSISVCSFPVKKLIFSPVGGCHVKIEQLWILLRQGGIIPVAATVMDVMGKKAD